jgi:tetratricopeptide (TPR) repeat protein
MASLAEVLVDRGGYDEAETLLQEALEIRRALGEQDVAVGLTLGFLGRLYARRGEFARAEGLYDRALEVLLSRQTAEHPDVRSVRREFAELYEGWGRPEEAARYRRLAEVVNRP